MVLKKHMMLLIVVLLSFLCAGCLNLTSKNLAPIVSFNEYKDENIPINVELLILDDFIEKMPELAGGDENLWPWFFESGLKPTFKNTYIIKNINEKGRNSNTKIVIKPELWGFFFQHYYQNWVCWLDFKFRFFDAEGMELFAISAEGVANNSDALRTLALTMDAVVLDLQKQVLFEKKKEILSIASGTNKLEPTSLESNLLVPPLHQSE